MSEKDEVTIEADGAEFLRMCRVVSKGQRGRAWTAYFTGWDGKVGLRIGRNELAIPASVSRAFSVTFNRGTVRSLVQANDPALCERLLLSGAKVTFGRNADVSFETRVLDLDPHVEQKTAERLQEKLVADASLNQAIWAVDVTKGLQDQGIQNAIESVEAATETLYWLGVRREDVIDLVKRVRRGEGSLRPPIHPFPRERDLY